MPTRSSGCYTCRKRKIRCDETRPGCQRCATHGVHCPGYRLPAPGQIAFEDQTVLTVKRATEKYKTGSGPAVTTFTIQNNSSDETALSSFTSTSEYGKPLDFTTISVDEIFYEGSPDSSTIYGSNSSSGSGSDDTEDLDFTTHISQPESRAASPTFGFFSFTSGDGFNTPVSTPRTLLSPALQRTQLYNNFISEYVPKCLPSSDGNFTFLQTVTNLPDAPPELVASLDALSMVQLGSIHHDQTLLKHAVRAYSRSLGFLARTLAKPGSLHNDHALAVVSILSTCEFFDEIASASGDGWTRHLGGLEQLFCARGPDSVQSELALMLFSEARHAALSHSLIRRKPSFLARPEWRALARRGQDEASGFDRSTAFYDIALQVPEVLERYDVMIADRPDNVAEIEDILSMAYRLEAGLRGMWNVVMLHRETLYTKLDIEQFPVFASLCADRTIKEAYMFPNFIAAYFMAIFWNVMHHLRSVIQELHKALHSASKSWYPAEEEVVSEEELLDYVMNICRCLPFFVEPISGASGQIGLFLPSRTIALYAVKQSHWHLLRWIAAVRDNVFVKGMSPPQVPDQLLPGFVSLSMTNARFLPLCLGGPKRT